MRIRALLAMTVGFGAACAVLGTEILAALGVLVLSSPVGGRVFVIAFTAAMGVICYWVSIGYKTPPVALEITPLGANVKDRSGREYTIRWAQKHLRISIETFTFNQEAGTVLKLRVAWLWSRPKIFMTEMAANAMIEGARRAGLKIVYGKNGEDLVIKS